MTTQVVPKTSLAELLARKAAIDEQINQATIETPTEFIAQAEVAEKAAAEVSPETLMKLQKLTNPLKQAAIEAKETQAWDSLTVAMRAKILKALTPETLNSGDQDIDTTSTTFYSDMVYAKLPYLVRNLPEGLSLEVKVVQNGVKSWPITVDAPLESVRTKIIRETMLSVASKTAFDFGKYHINAHIDPKATTPELQITFMHPLIGKVVKNKTVRTTTATSTRAEPQERHRTYKGYNSKDGTDLLKHLKGDTEKNWTSSAIVVLKADYDIDYYDLPVW